MLFVGRNGNVHAKSAKIDTLAHCCCAKVCHSKFRLFLISPSSVIYKCCAPIAVK